MQPGALTWTFRQTTSSARPPSQDVWGRRGYTPFDPRFSPKLTEVSKRSETQLHANLRIPQKSNSQRREKPDTCICALTGTRTSIPGLGNLCSVLLSYEGDSAKLRKNRLYSKSAIQAISGYVGLYGTRDEVPDRLPCLHSLANITR